MRPLRPLRLLAMAAALATVPAPAAGALALDDSLVGAATAVRHGGEPRSESLRGSIYSHLRVTAYDLDP